MIPTVWQRAQLWLGDNAADELAIIGGGTVEDAVKRIVECGFSAIHVKLQDGQTEENGATPDTPSIPAQLKAARITTGKKLLVGGWSQNRNEAHADADKTNGLIAREGLDYWVTAAEFEYKGVVGSEPFNRMSVFYNRLKEISPAKEFALQNKLALCSMPNEPNASFSDPRLDFVAARGANARWLPECYPNEFPGSAAIWPAVAQQVAAAQFFKSYVHPVLGFYGDHYVPASDYIDSMRIGKQWGFTWGYSVYLPHNLRDSDWQQFKAVNKPAGTIAALAWY